ncbi:DUF2834 domain-containing protein [Cochlodiniinecator piscidefendens]|uniref:DUF2834 domain-containing protein n=1 Tax=Cochlodiniinecator piscidefendens TaxID=2715756 RepID=UPI001408DDBD|nr:DUF2834 domain-containing protein [Cochlodiniinecator piscidefendens]
MRALYIALGAVFFVAWLIAIYVLIGAQVNSRETILATGLIYLIVNTAFLELLFLAWSFMDARRRNIQYWGQIALSSLVCGPGMGFAAYLLMRDLRVNHEWPQNHEI